ncbi:hypothetical protein Ddye_000604 [Dipteronia dyeriana]|uniref:Uncharacterized protein n=1 Tax=Dipteronia dyeriana TaxID=168575 RepID=A0AAD9XMQ2_9ROSI|nr:hypothetical protein Ddye_000604 [Dipteronia dyeriana]
MPCLIFALEVIPELAKEVGVWMVTDLTPRILKWELTKQPKGKKLAKIFKARMFVLKELVSTPAERRAPYYACLDDGGPCGISGTDRTIDSEGSKPAAGGLRPSDSEGYQTDPQRERHRHRHRRV